MPDRPSKIMGIQIVTKDGMMYKIKEYAMTSADGSEIVVVEDHAPGGVAHWQAPLRLTQKMENIMRRKH